MNKFYINKYERYKISLYISECLNEHFNLKYIVDIFIQNLIIKVGVFTLLDNTNPINFLHETK